MKTVDDKKTAVKLSENEQKVINIIRNTEYGELKIIVQDKQPIILEEVIKVIKL